MTFHCHHLKDIQLSLVHSYRPNNAYLYNHGRTCLADGLELHFQLEGPCRAPGAHPRHSAEAAVTPPRRGPAGPGRVPCPPGLKDTARLLRPPQHGRMGWKLPPGQAVPAVGKG